MVERLLNDVARALPDRRFLVAGPQYPETVRWASNVRHLPHIAPARHPSFYSSASWQLNATRADMVVAGWSPSVRLFEAGACAAAVISDRWAGIDEMFEPGREIALPAGTEETRALVADTHPDDRRAMGAALRRRILTEHTSERRAEQLEAFLRAPVASR